MKAIVAALIVLACAVPCAAQQVTPYLDCIDFLPDAQMRAHFGYASTYPSEVTIDIGPQNYFSPGTLSRGQPTVFLPGEHHDVFTTSWVVSGSSTQETWLVAGATAVGKQTSTTLCGVRSKGDWDSTAKYEVGDLVRDIQALWVFYGDDRCVPGLVPASHQNCWYPYFPVPPALSPIADQTTAEDTPLPPIPFTVTDSDGTWIVKVFAESSDPALIPVDHITIGGWADNRTIAITPALNRSGSATITLHATDGLTEAHSQFVVTVGAVNDPPTISSLSNVTIDENTSTSALAFAVDDPDSDASSLTVTATSSNPAVVPVSPIVIAGSGATRTVTLTPLADAFGTSTIKLTVSDGTLSASSSFTLTVRPIDHPEPQPTPTADYLAEGATGTFFDTDILIANPQDTAVPATITFLKETGTPVSLDMTIAPLSRTTINVDAIPGMESTAFSTVVTSKNGLPLIVERTMWWDKSHYGSHTEKATTSASTTWLFAEGSQGFFSTYFLLVNPQTTANTAHVTYLREGEPVLVRDYALPPQSRVTIDAGADHELVNRSFGAEMHFDQPGGAERAMYFGPSFAGGTASAGVNAPSTDWFLAEGATGSFFNTFLLLANPGADDSTATLTYLPSNGVPVVRTHAVPARRRVTINIADESPALANAAVATKVSATAPILVERSQYWPQPTWEEGHNSFGETALGTHWGLAEGRVGGANNCQTFILLANPGTVAATVTVKFLRTTGTPITKTFIVAPTSRFTVAITGPGSDVPELLNEFFGATIASTQPIMVERALYSDANGIVWAAGTNATATRLP